MSDQPGLADGTSDPMTDAIRHGDDLNDWYQRDTERLKAEAKLGAYEVGERTRFNANRFVGKIPELGDVGKLVENYSKDFKQEPIALAFDSHNLFSRGVHHAFHGSTLRPAANLR